MAKIFNVSARAVIARISDPPARALLRAGVSPDAVTAFGTVGVLVGAVVFALTGNYLAGTIIVTLSAFTDLLDGTMARLRGRSTKFGALLDSTCDRIADAAVFGSLAWYFARHDQPWLLAASLICLVLGALTSYIRARAEGLGLNATVGIAERAERLIIILIGTGLTGDPFNVPYALAIAIWLLVAASAVTVVQRIVTVYRQDRKAAAS
jgi:CDP-diacylglycerol--glycerol-3-phosphate 3-phosphatidyltransferase